MSGSITTQEKSKGCLLVPLADLPGRSACASPCGISAQGASLPCAPFWNSLSHGSANRDSSVSSSFPSPLSERILAPPVMFVETRRHPLEGTRVSLEGPPYCAD